MHGAVDVSGWAVDQTSCSGTGIDVMQLYVNGPADTGTVVAQMAYGDPRPDVAAYLGG